MLSEIGALSIDEMDELQGGSGLDKPRVTGGLSGAPIIKKSKIKLDSKPY